MTQKDIKETEGMAEPEKSAAGKMKFRKSSKKSESGIQDQSAAGNQDQNQDQSAVGNQDQSAAGNQCKNQDQNQDQTAAGNQGKNQDQNQDQTAPGNQGENQDQTAAAQSNNADKTPADKDSQAELSSKIDELQKALAKEKDDYIRLMAEFENFRRRTAAQRQELISTASEKIILELLPVLDDCERAMKALAQSTDSAAAKEGTELIYNKLLGTLKAKGLKEIEAQDAPFDTEVMEAVAQFPVQEEDKKGKVFDVVQKGYKLSDKVIRYAKVVVGQ